MLCPHNLTHEFKLTWIKCQVPWTYWTSNIMCFVVLYEPFLFIVCIWKKFSCEHDNGLIVLHDLKSLDLDIDQHLITSGLGEETFPLSLTATLVRAYLTQVSHLLSHEGVCIQASLHTGYICISFIKYQQSFGHSKHSGL